MELLTSCLEGCKNPNECCEYKSIRYITVHNKKLASIYWLTMALVLCYVIGFTIIREKGYQATNTVKGTTSAKVKGSACIGDLKNYKDIKELLPLDIMDVRVPANEEGALFMLIFYTIFFIYILSNIAQLSTTARTITKNQTRKFCNGNHRVPICTTDDTSACEQKLFSWDSQGLFTGECGDNGRCQMYSWCPLENRSKIEVINNIGALTVFVKVAINFEEFDVFRDNQYDIKGTKHPVFGYNLFRIDDILSNATDGKITSYKQIAKTGAVILMSSVWNCNLDHAESKCNPKYGMKRIDDTPNTVSVGFNFRNVDYNPTQTNRVLKKLFGIRIVFIVEGKAGKFSWVELSVTLGAGMAYLGLASIITDVVLENFLPESETYVEHKEKTIRHKMKSVLDKAVVAGQLNSQFRSSKNIKFRKSTASLSLKSSETL